MSVLNPSDNVDPADRRQAPRKEVEDTAMLRLSLPGEIDEHHLNLKMEDVSTLGAGVMLTDEKADEFLEKLPLQHVGELVVDLEKGELELPCKIVWKDADSRFLGLWFEDDAERLANNSLFAEWAGQEGL